MPRADTMSNSFAIRKPFEELPLVTLFIASGEPWTTGYVSGEFEVVVSWVDGDWHFSDLWVSADNRKMWPDARGGLLGGRQRDHAQ